MSAIRLLLSLRPVNLLLSGLILVSVRIGLFGIAPAENRLDFLYYLAYTVSVLCTMAFGYLINDLYDVETDRINKPGKNIFETGSGPGAATLIAIPATAAVAIPFGLCLVSRLPGLCIWINFAALCILHLYARKGKGTVLWGNFLVAFLSLLLFVAAYIANAGLSAGVPADALPLFWVYAFFSFALTAVREIVKDAQDVEGDRQSGIVTLATRYGLSASRRWALGISAPLPVLLAATAFWLYPRNERAGIAFAVLAITGIFTLFKVWQSNRPAQSGLTSLWLKLYMALGIMSMWI